MQGEFTCKSMPVQNCLRMWSLCHFVNMEEEIPDSKIMEKKPPIKHEFLTEYLISSRFLIFTVVETNVRPDHVSINYFCG